jgi:hypothetical protein
VTWVVCVETLGVDGKKVVSGQWSVVSKHWSVLGESVVVTRVGFGVSHREASQTRDLFARKERGRFARLDQILRRTKGTRLRMTVHGRGLGEPRIFLSRKQEGVKR